MYLVTFFRKQHFAMFSQYRDFTLIFYISYELHPYIKHY